MTVYEYYVKYTEIGIVAICNIWFCSGLIYILYDEEVALSIVNFLELRNADFPPFFSKEG